jgi:hypothetical protein
MNEEKEVFMSRAKRREILSRMKRDALKEARNVAARARYAACREARLNREALKSNPTS